MKKILLSVFSSVLLTSSASLTAGTNVNTGVKLTEKKQVVQEFLKTSYQINTQNELNKIKIEQFQISSQNWDDQEIDFIFNQALEYNTQQLTINQKKLDFAKLPPELLNHLDLIVANLNNAVSVGYIQAYIINNDVVQLNYPNNLNSISNYNRDNEIIDFGAIENEKNKSSINSSSYMWYSTYGPSHWWKFWEWGGYLHFNETATQVAKPINFIATILDLFFLIKNVKELSKLTTQLTIAKSSGNTSEINSLMPKLAKLLGSDFGATFTAMILDNLTVIVMVLAFFLTITTTPGFGTFWAALAQLFVSAVAKVTGDMIAADQGHGVKWQWPCFIIPGTISSE